MIRERLRLWGLRRTGRRDGSSRSCRQPCGFRIAEARKPELSLVAHETEMLLEAPTIPIGRTRRQFAASTAEAPEGAGEVATSWASLPGGVVDGGEIVILAIKPSMWQPAVDAAPWLICSALAAVLAATFQFHFPGVSLAVTTQLILIVGFARLGLAIARWIPTWHVLTNRRIIDVQGVRAPVIASCPLVHIRNTYLKVSPLERQLRLGSIAFVATHKADPPRVWRMIAKPEEVHDKVRRAIENALDHHGV